MDLITNIETQMVECLKRIDVAVPAPSGYVYYNTVTIVNKTDEACALDFGEYPTIAVYMDTDENNEDAFANAFMNTIRFKIEGNVAITDESDNPRFDIRVKMNELLSDIKAIFGNYPTINCSCDNSHLTNSTRIYNVKNDEFRVGQLEVWVEVQYSQLRADPNYRCIV